MSSINFDNAWLLLIAIPVVALIAVPFFISINKDNRSGHNIASCALHIFMAVLIAFSAAGTSVQTVLTATDVYVVADVSYSANRNLDVIDGYITDLSKNLPKNSQMGIVCFGADAVTLTRLGGELKSVKEAEVDDSRTDIVSALEYASRLFRSNSIKRIVLITDGRQSDESDSDALKQKVAELNAENIYIDAIYLDDNITDDINEVQITSVDCGETVYSGQSAEATALIQSTYATNAILTLSENGGVIETKTAALNAGSTSVVFTLPTELSDGYDGADEGETHQYEITVAVDDDYSPYNNSCSFTQTVISTMKILFISSSNEDYDAINSMYGSDDSVEVDSYVNYEYVPYTIADLCEYDEIILADVDVSTLYNYEIFIESLETVVSMLGKSLIGMGNLYLQNTTDEYMLKLADMLPVNYGNSSDERTLYTLVIDGSDSMLSGAYYGLEKAKSIANQLLDIMQEQDAISLVVFYGSVYVHLSPTTLTDAEYTYDGVTYTGRSAVEKAIDTIDGKHGTMVGYGLQSAGELITSLDYDTKRIILVSDGLTNENDISEDEVESLVKDLYYNGITTTVIDVGRGNDSSGTAEIAAQLLNTIASAGSGGTSTKIDATESTKVVDSSIFAEIVSDLGEVVSEGVMASVDVNRYYDEVLDGLKAGGYITDYSVNGYITGFIVSKAKTGSTTVLTTDYDRGDGSGTTTIPIYTYRSYGNGTTASFASSIASSWMGSWAKTGADDVLLASIVSTNTPEERVSDPFTVTINEETGYCSLEVTPVEVRLNGAVTVTITEEESGEVTTVSNVTFTSSSYTCTFSITEVGRYAVDVSYTSGGETYTHRSYVNISYLNEYDSFASCDSTSLYKAISSSGTVSTDGTLKIENDEDEVGIRTIYLTIPLMAACVVLFAVDIIIRKLKWEDIRSLFIKVNRGKKG